MKPFFTVVIPLYNKENQIGKTLKSVLNQSLLNFEIIIVNDGSTDGSMKVVYAFDDDRIRIINNSNEGVSKARNIGIQESRAKYVALLDADDIWYPTHLEDLKRLIKNYPNCGLYCTAYDTLYYNKKIVKGIYSGLDKEFYGVVPDYFLNSLIDGIALTSAVAIPKAMIEKYGDFNVNLRSGQDTELWIRIVLEEKIAFSSKISVRRIIATSSNHLSLSDKRIDKLKFLDQFKDSERINKSLKKYMDINRYAIVLERKMSGDVESFRKIKVDIDLDNLNYKQKFTLLLPGLMLKLLKKFQRFLIKNKVYLTTFR